MSLLFQWCERDDAFEKQSGGLFLAKVGKQLVAVRFRQDGRQVPPKIIGLKFKKNNSNHRYYHFNGASGGTRTHTLANTPLKRARLPFRHARKY